MTCASCGQDDHARSSSKKCLNYKPRLANIRPGDTTISRLKRVIKMKLNGFLTDQGKELLVTLSEFSDQFDRVSFLGAKVAQLYVLDHLENARTIPVIDQALAYNWFTSVTVDAKTSKPKVTRFGTINAVRDKLATVTSEWVTVDHFGQFIASLAKSYLINCMNNVTTNLETRSLQYIRHRLASLSFVSMIDASKTADWFKRHLSKPLPPEFPCGKNAFVPDAGQREEMERLFTDIDVKLTMVGERRLSLEEGDVKESWWEYLPILWEIQKEFGKKHLADTEGRREEPKKHGRKTETKREPRTRIFCLMPQHSYGKRFLPIDTTALRDILFRSKHPVVTNVTREAFRDRADEMWATFFRTDVVKNFNYRIETDLVAVTINHTKIVRRVADATRASDRDILDLTGKEVIGNDPGHNDLTTCAYGDGTVVRCSTARYHDLAGFNREKRLRERWLKKAPDIDVIQRDIPTPKVGNTESFLTHCRYVAEDWKRLHDYYAANRFRQSSFRSHVGRQKAYSIICKEMLRVEVDKFYPDKVVAYGAASFSCFGGQVAPVKQLFRQLKRRCVVRKVDEFRTSITCSNCHAPFPKKREMDPYKSKQCANEACRKLWHRDVNAAENIRRVFIHMCMNEGRRPEAFSRTVSTDSV